MTVLQYNFYPTLTPVRLASTSNVSGTYSNGPTNNGVGATLTIAASSLTIDGVACAVGDRVLLQTQTNTYEQGIYVVDSIGSTVVLKRSDDMNDIENMLHAGLSVAVGAGSVNAGNFYTLVEPLPAQIGVDAIVFNADPSAGGVTFSGGPSTANAIPVFSDAAGNIKPANAAPVTLGQNLSVTGTGTFSGALSSTAGDITSGSSGNAGSFISFPATAANGTLILEALNAGGAFNTTIRNSVMGQSSVISIPDPGAATANFLLDAGTNASGTFTLLTVANTGLHILDTNASHDLIIAPGSDLTADRTLTVTTGDADRTLDISAASVTVSTFGASLVDDAAASNARTTLQIFSGVTADIGGGGAGPISVVVAGMSAASAVVATIASSTNTVAVAKCISTATGFDITFDGDPGAACVVNYVAVGA